MFLLGGLLILAQGSAIAPRFAPLIFEHLIDLKPDGTFRLNLDFFDYCTGLTMTNGWFDELFGGPPRKPEELLTQREMDLAASIQVVTEEVVLRLSRSIARSTGLKKLCLAGGVALNCVANGKVLRDRQFEDIWVQPAAGDAGGALGAALIAYHLYQGQPRKLPGNGTDLMKGAYLRPSFAREECEQRLRAVGAQFTVLDDVGTINACAQSLADGKALGWFQERMEFGPRALGGRSVLGDAVADNAVGLEPQGQIPRVVSAVRAFGAA
jgi:carbamoyltransferase